jgi:5-dehydro-2-deoxygluconokinase
MIAGGADDPLAALRAVRALSQAALALKRGPMGCVVFPGAVTTPRAELSASC